MVTTDSELIYKIAITQIPKIGAVTARQLISYCGSPEEVFRASKGALMKIPSVAEKMANNILDFSSQALKVAEDELNFMSKNEIKFLYYLDKEYPQRLKHYADAPLSLYYKGNVDLNTDKIVSVVGTRTPSSYGKLYCEEFVENLKEYNVLVVSGLAYGIDVIAHRQCVEHEVPTVGVLGSGFNRLYPSEHKSVARKMLENGGLLTEYTSNQGPDREHFPMRNRIIAGMCDAVIVVETAEHGGSVITVNFANDYSKDVFALPGRVGDEMSIGCNKLIKQNKANLMESVDDLAYIMRWEKTSINNKRQHQRSMFWELEEEEQNIVNLIRDNKDATIDFLTYKLNKPPSEMAALILSLEFKGVITQVPGKRYILL